MSRWVSEFEHNRVKKELEEVKRYCKIDSVYIDTRILELIKILDTALGGEEECKK